MLFLTQNQIDDNFAVSLSFAAGGRSDTALHPQKKTWGWVKSRLSKVDIGDKDGSYFIRGGDLIKRHRADENLRSADFVILDGDSRIDPETGEIITGAPPMEEVCAALSDMGLAYAAHTSHSYKRGVLSKFRVVIPTKMQTQEELAASVDYIIDELHNRQCWLANVTENKKWSQAWFLPRTKDAENFKSMAADGKMLDVTAILRWKSERDGLEEAIKQTITKPPAKLVQNNNDYKDFNDKHGLDSVRSALSRAGYRFSYYDKSHDTYRYIRPGSESNTAGVVVFKGSQGHWCVYSHHGGADPLSGKVSDPFALFSILQFGGDTKKAREALFPKTVAEKVVSMATDSVTDKSSDKLATEAQQVQKKRVQLIKWRELIDTPVRWLVKDILPSESLFALYGQPGSYKSFVALYLSAMIASGRDAFDKRTEPGCVIYIAAEGGSGLKRRRDALIKAHDLTEDIPLFFIKAQLNLGTSEADIVELLEEVQALRQNVTLVVVDTLARSMGGLEENSSTEMSRFIENMSVIMSTLSCSVMLIHHAGKHAPGLRGSSSLLGAVDSSMECRKINVGKGDTIQRGGVMSILKQKDGEDDISFFYKMQSVQLSAIDPSLTSLAVIPEDKENMPASKKEEDKTRVALRVLAEVIDEEKRRREEKGMTADRVGVPKGQWMARFNEEAGDERSKPDTMRKAFERTLRKLIDDGLVSASNGIYTISSSADLSAIIGQRDQTDLDNLAVHDASF